MVETFSLFFIAATHCCIWFSFPTKRVFLNATLQSTVEHGVHSGAAGPPAGVRALGLHQPFPEEIHGGHRQCDQEQQSLPAPGRAQVSFFEPQLPRAIPSEPEWICGVLLHSVYHRTITCCSCDKLAHIPLHFAHWQVTGWRIWRQMGCCSHVSHCDWHHPVCNELHRLRKAQRVPEPALTASPISSLIWNKVWVGFEGQLKLQQWFLSVRI